MRRRYEDSSSDDALPANPLFGNILQRAGAPVPINPAHAEQQLDRKRHSVAPNGPAEFV